MVRFMELFRELFIHSFYKIKLIGMASNIVEKMFIFYIHNELYILQSKISELSFEKLDAKYDLNKELEKYANFSICKKEVVRKKKIKGIYDSNVLKIDEVDGRCCVTHSSFHIGKLISKEQFEIQINKLIYYK